MFETNRIDFEWASYIKYLVDLPFFFYPQFQKLKSYNQEKSYRKNYKVST